MFRVLGFWLWGDGPAATPSATVSGGMMMVTGSLLRQRRYEYKQK